MAGCYVASMPNEPIQQSNMFTGEWETKRTPRSHPQQIQMFSIKETFVFGQRVRPWLAEAPAPALVLIREDVRTPEEIERDLRREAEALTFPMFASEALAESEDTPEQPAPNEENGPSLPPAPTAASEEVTPLSCYHALVNLAHEQAVTVWVDQTYRGRFYAQLPQAILIAQGAGLTASEISAAMQIGEFQGKKEREAAAHVPAVSVEGGGATPSPLTTQTTTTEATAIPEVVPGFWMEREHIRKRLPHLAEGISRLGEDELASLAGSISEALQQSYWTILGTALAHYVDRGQEGRTA